MKIKTSNFNNSTLLCLFQNPLDLIPDCFLKFILDFFIPCSFLYDSEHKKRLSCLKAFVFALLLVPLTLTLGSFVCIGTTKSSVP